MEEKSDALMKMSKAELSSLLSSTLSTQPKVKSLFAGQMDFDLFLLSNHHFFCNLPHLKVESEKVGKLIQTLSDDVVKELAEFFGIKFMSSTSYDSVIEYLQGRYNKKESRFSVIARLSDTSKKQDTLFDWFSRLRSMTHQFKAKFGTELCDLVIIKDVISQLHEPLKIESIKYVESTSLKELNLTNFLSYVETLQLASSIDQIDAFKVVRKKRQRKNPRYRKRSSGTKQKDVDAIYFDSVDFLSTCSKFITVNLSSKVSCNMKVDTGADDSVIPFSFYKKNLSNVPLQKTSKIYTSATNAPIKVYGFFNFSFDNVSYPCYVADVARPLLGGNAAWMAVQLLLSSRVDEIKHDPNLLSNIKQKFPNLFNLSGKQTGVHDNVVDDDILNHPPIFIPPRRIPLGLENDVKSIIEDWEKQNIITKHTSIAKWNTPLCLVKASTKPLRICMDFSATVNRVTSTRCTLLDNFDVLFRDLSDACFFTHLDLSSAFLQLRLSDSLSSIMTFKVLDTTYKWLRCPFGYKNSPYHMQTFLSWVLRDCVEFTKIYYDDILIYASNMSDLTKFTFQVCEQLDRYNFVLNEQKSVFGSNVVCFLGWKIQDGKRYWTDAAKNSILSIRSPQNVADIRTILGVCAHYADAIPNLMNFIPLLSPLCRKYAKFEWNSKLESLFQKFKASILSLSHSYFFKNDRPTYLSCDASSIAIGGVLEQQVNIGGKSIRVPVLFFSKALSQSQINYSQTEKELFALITGLQKFKYYIMASNCKVFVDHKALCYLIDVSQGKKPIPDHISGRLQRWLLIVQSYCLSVDFIPTSNFCMPDLLSRMVATMDTSSELVISEMCVEREFAAVNFNTFFSESDFRSAASEDVDICRIKKFLSDGFPVFTSLSKHDKWIYRNKKHFVLKDDVLFYKDRYYLPSKLIPQLLKQLHRNHNSVASMYSMVLKECYFKNCYEDLMRLWKDCAECQQSRRKPPIRFSFWKASRPRQFIHLDICYCFGHKILLAVDNWSDFPSAWLLKSITSSSIISCCKEYLLTYGPVEFFIVDSGRQFISKEFLSVFLNVKIVPPEAHHCNGKVERHCQNLKKFVKQNYGSKITDILDDYLFKYRYETISLGQEPSYHKFFNTIVNFPRILNMKTSENVNEKVRQFSIKQTVKAFHKTGTKWREGIIIDKLSDFIYAIRLSNGAVITRHVNEIIN